MGRDYGTQYRHGIYPHSAEQMAAARACVARVQAALPPGKRCHTEVVEAQVFWPAKEMHRAPHALHTPTPRPVTARLVVCSCRVRCVLAQSNTCRRAAGSAARSRRARAARIASAATADGRHRHAYRRGAPRGFDDSVLNENKGTAASQTLQLWKVIGNTVQ